MFQIEIKNMANFILLVGISRIIKITITNTHQNICNFPSVKKLGEAIKFQNYIFKSR